MKIVPGLCLYQNPVMNTTGQGALREWPYYPPAALCQSHNPYHSHSRNALILVDNPLLAISCMLVIYYSHHYTGLDSLHRIKEGAWASLLLIHTRTCKCVTQHTQSGRRIPTVRFWSAVFSTPPGSNDWIKL